MNIDCLPHQVLFGAPHDAARYQRVLEACALEADLAALPSGDATEIGERGVTLSGGQKARVSLARALYADADVYLLDDVLSAVDAHVGRHLVDQALGATLVANGRTVLLASHQLSVIDRADRVLILRDGHVAFDGTPASCRASEAFAAIRGEHDSEADLSMGAVPRWTATPEVGLVYVKEGAPAAPADGASSKGVGAGSRGSEGVDGGDSGGSEAQGGQSAVMSAQEGASADLGKLTAAEDRETGSVSMRVLATYGRLGGSALAALALALLVLKSGAAVGCQGWVAAWTAKTSSPAKASSPASANATSALGLGPHEPPAAYAPFAIAQDETMWYISIYALLSLGALIFVLVQQLSCVTLSINASARVHAHAFRAISRAPISFFETTPTGRILARFGNDMNVVDTMLMKSLNQSGSQFCVLIVVFIMNACLVPWLVAISLPLIVVCTRPTPQRTAIAPTPATPLPPSPRPPLPQCPAPFHRFPFFSSAAHYGACSSAADTVLAQLYRRSSRELKRLENIAETPVYSGFASCMDGLLTIRAFRGSAERLTQQTDRTIDDWVACWLKNNIANRWMGIRLDMIGAGLSGSVGLFGLLWADGVIGDGAAAFNAGVIGLMLSFTASQASMLNWMVRGVAEAEQHATSFERCLTMANVPPERWGDEHDDGGDDRAAAEGVAQDGAPTKSTSKGAPDGARDGARDARKGGRLSSAEMTAIPTAGASVAVAAVPPTAATIAHTNWPTIGAIEICELSMRYRPGLPLVLNGVSLSIRGGERVGICGRTGSGQSLSKCP
jgi:ATP-binding cassette, subfamily C (CFTR/MRP), member 1